MTKLLIVTPAFNEEATLPRFIEAFREFRDQQRPALAVKLLVVDDGSVDGTRRILEAAARAEPDDVGYVSLSANAGHQAALIAGLCHAGPWPDAIVTMDADLEHPFPVAARLVEAWRETGAIVVHAIRKASKALPVTKRWPSALFYRVTSWLTGLQMSPGQADFRLWDATALRSVHAYLPNIGSLRVFAAWIPGPKTTVTYEQHVAPGRTSRFTFRKNYELAAISIIRFSNLPLKAITLAGAIGLLFSIAYGSFVAVETARGNTVPGWSSTVLVVMAMGCLQLIAIGTLASYLRRLVFARDLPPFVIRQAHVPGDERSSHQIHLTVDRN